MRIQIQDLTSGEVYDIGPNGATLGRESARTDISIPDEAISKKHARILLLDGQWYLEDLNSSNGTFIDGGRIHAQALLENGTGFSLSQRNFSVLQIISSDGEDDDEEHKPNFYGPDSEEISHLSEQGDEPISMPEPIQSTAGLDDQDPIGKQLINGLFKSIIYYLKVTPAIALQPAVFVRRGIDKQEWPAMSSLLIFSYALPAFIFGGLGVTVARMLMELLNGSFSPAPFMESIAIGLLAGLGSALITAFLWHPVCSKFIQILGGESSARARTNYALMFFATLVFMSFAVSIQAILSALSIPFINTLSPLLLVLGTITMSYLITSWNKYFGIIKSAHLFILALSLLSVLGATVYFGDSVHASVMNLYANPAPDKAQTQAAAVRNETETTTTTKEQKIRATTKASTEATTKTKIQAKSAVAGVNDPNTAKPSTAQATVVSNNFAQQQTGSNKSIEGATKFETFLNKRNAIEERIKNDPVLIREKKILREYSRIWKLTYDLREKYRRKKGKRWERERIYSRQKDADIYDATHKLVDSLYERIMNP